MRKKRTPEEEQIRQLRIISGQLNPLGALIKVGFWLTTLLFALGFWAQLSMPGFLKK